MTGCSRRAAEVAAVVDVHDLRWGYNLADIDLIARQATAGSHSRAVDVTDRYECAWHAVAEALYASTEPPTRSELKQRALGAIDEERTAHRRHHGFDARNKDAGYEAAVRFLSYWELDRRTHGFESGVVDRVALWQIWPQLSETDRRTLLALVAHDGDQVAAAAALGKGRSTYVTALSTARHRFLALWLEGETPQRRVWGKADRRRSTRYSGTALVAVRRQQRARRALLRQDCA